MTWIRNRPLGLVYRDEAKSFGGYTLFSPVRGHHADLLDPDGSHRAPVAPSRGHPARQVVAERTPAGAHPSAGVGRRRRGDRRVVGRVARARPRQQRRVGVPRPLHAPRLPAARQRQHARHPVGEAPDRRRRRGCRAVTSRPAIPTGCGATSCARSTPPGTSCANGGRGSTCRPTITSSARWRAARSGRTSTRSRSCPTATGWSASG